MADYKIGKDGALLFNNDRNIEKTEEDKLQKEYSLLEYEILNNHGNPTKDPEKIARYEELKKILGIDENTKNNAFLKAKQKFLDSISQKKTTPVSEILAMGKEKQNE